MAYRALKPLTWLLVAVGVVVLAHTLGPTFLSAVTDEMSAPLQFTSKALPRAQSLLRQLRSAEYFSPATTSHTLSAASITAPRAFSTSAAKMGYDTMTLKDAILNRRTIYALQKKSPVPDSKIKELVETAILNVPSSFNSQSTRMVVLIKQDHDKFWDTTTEILKAIVPEAGWDHTKQRMDMFKGAYGTILFYEDPQAIKKLQEQFPIYAEKFAPWSEHTSAMHQYMLWTSLEAEGFGCNLQHYNPLPDQKAAEIWNVPKDWSLVAQMVFGEPQEGARDKLPNKTQGADRTFFHGF